MYKKPTVHTDLMSISAANPLDSHVSGPRKTMFASYLSQTITVAGLEVKYLSSGIDTEFAKTTLNKKIECNAEIIEIIDRYPVDHSDEKMSKNNPQTLVVYMDLDEGRLDIIDIQSYMTLHSTFGVKYNLTDEMKLLTPNKRIEKGTVLAKVPNISEEEIYMSGVNANVLMIDDPSAIEDGYLILDEFSDKLTPTAIIHYEFTIGENEYPANLHGTPDKYKCLLDIGDTIPSHGLIFATREYDPIAAVVNMTPNGLCDIDHDFDDKVYGEPGAKIIDINVVCNLSNPFLSTPVGMEEQLKKYYNADTRFYKKLLDCYYSQSFKFGGKLKTSERLDQYVTQAIHRLGPDYRPNKSAKWTEVAETDNVQTLYRNSPIPNWRIVVTALYSPTPGLGQKGTCSHAGKGVATKKVTRDQMYRDAYGNVPDLVFIPQSKINRNNQGGTYEQYINASGRDLVVRIWNALNYDQHDYTNNKDRLNHFHKAPKDLIDYWYDQYTRYCEILFPKRAKVLKSDRYLNLRNDIKEYTLFNICTEPKKRKPDGIHHLYPVDNDIDLPEAINTIIKEFPVFRSTFTFMDEEGNMKETIMEGIIGSMGFYPLEKIAIDCCAVGSAKFSHYGNTARSSDKHSSPRKININKTIDESGCRMLSGTMGSKMLADQMDLANDPIGHMLANINILTHPTPTNIEEIVSRKDHPVGGHRPKKYIKHMFECSGKIIYSPDDLDDEYGDY